MLFLKSRNLNTAEYFHLKDSEKNVIQNINYSKELQNKLTLASLWRPSQNVLSVPSKYNNWVELEEDFIFKPKYKEAVI